MRTDSNATLSWCFAVACVMATACASEAPLPTVRSAANQPVTPSPSAAPLYYAMVPVYMVAAPVQQRVVLAAPPPAMPSPPRNAPYPRGFTPRDSPLLWMHQ